MQTQSQSTHTASDCHKEMNMSSNHTNLLSTRYKVLREIGKGGFGKVSLVQHLTSKQQFACKIIPKVVSNPSKPARNIRSAHREVEMLEKLRGNKEIIQLHEVFEDMDNFYMVMENCKGGTINEHVSKLGKHLHENQVRDIIKKALQLVAVCHDNDIIHNDIKLENMLLAEEEDLSTLKLIDFGTSLVEEEKTTTTFMEGTPWYTSPESLESKICKKSDVWSVGVMTHLLLVGKFPFNDKKNPFNPSIYKIWNSILNDNVSFNSSQWCIISEQAKDFVRTLLSKNLHDRPTVYEALVHPWILKTGGSTSTNTSTNATTTTSVNAKLGQFVVQNIAKYSKKNIVMRSIFEEFVDIVLAKLSHIPKSVLETDASIQDNSLGRNPTGAGITSLHSERLNYLLHVLKENMHDVREKVSTADFIAMLKRMNYNFPASQECLNLLTQECEPTNIDITKVVASQMDWEALLDNSTHFEQFLAEVFQNMDKDNKGIVSKADIEPASACTLLFNKSWLSFDEFLERARDVVQSYDMPDVNGGPCSELCSMDTNKEEARVHGTSKALTFLDTLAE